MKKNRNRTRKPRKPQQSRTKYSRRFTGVQWGISQGYEPRKKSTSDERRQGKSMYGLSPLPLFTYPFNTLKTKHNRRWEEACTRIDHFLPCACPPSPPASEKLDAFYRRKPLVVARRFVEVSSSLARFLLSVLADVLTNNWDKNMRIRAVQMREFTSSNGPAFIKVEVLVVECWLV